MPMLTFSGMRDLGIGYGFDLQFHGVDKSDRVFLHVGDEDNRVMISGTSPRSRQEEVLDAIDSLEKWGEEIPLWLTTEKNGTRSARSGVVKYQTYVKPFYGDLTTRDIGSDSPAMTYPGSRIGRLLSRQINGRYYFTYGGRLECEARMRGFDCTTFPMALFQIPRLTGDGYGKQVCEAVNAAECKLEQIKSADMRQRFKDKTIPVGVYVLFSAGHVMLYDGYNNVLHEFNYGGYRKTPAAERQLPAPQDLWWMRKLPDKYRTAFI